MKSRVVAFGGNMLHDRASRCAPGACRGWLPVAVFPREETTGEGMIGKNARAIFLAPGHDFTLDTALQEVVIVLDGDVTRHIVCLSDRRRLSQAPGCIITCADCNDLSSLHQCVKSGQDFLRWSLCEGSMDLIQIDSIGLQLL